MSQRTDEFIAAEQQKFAEQGLPAESTKFAAENLLAVYAVATADNALETFGGLLVQLAPTFDVAPVNGILKETMRNFTAGEMLAVVDLLKAQPEDVRLVSLSALFQTSLIAWQEQLQNAKRQYTSAGSSAEN